MIQLLFFVLGIMTGTLFTLCLLMLAHLYRSRINAGIKYAERKAAQHGVGEPHRGIKIFTPVSDERLAQDEIVARNAREGRDTSIDELI